MIELWGFLFASTVGTIGHFLYKWSKGNAIIGFFFARNESIWSHLKLGITPILLWSIVEKRLLINNSNVWAIKGFSLIIFSAIIIIFFYLSKLLKKENYIFNIILFYVAIFGAYLTSFLLLNSIYIPFFIKLLGLSTIFLIIFLYIYEAIFKPNYLIFKIPKSK